MSGGGLTFYLIFDIVTMLLMDWLGVCFGFAGLFFLLCLISIENLISIFTLGAPFVTPS